MTVAKQTLSLSASYRWTDVLTEPVYTSKGRLRTALSLLNAGDMGASHDFFNTNRVRFLQELDIDPRRVTGVRQIHSKIVYYVLNSTSVSGREGDGLITDNPDVILGVTVADCLPVFLFGRESGCFGIVHSGWKGTGIAEKALERMGEIDSCSVSSGIDRRHADCYGTIDMIIGPGIGSCCYTVDKTRAHAFSSKYGEQSVIPGNPPRVDLRAANLSLVTHGAAAAAVTVITNCTACSPFLGSFRREGADTFTRMIALIGYF